MQPEEPVAFDQALSNLYIELVTLVAEVLPTCGNPVVVEGRGSLWLLPLAAWLIPQTGLVWPASGPCSTLPRLGFQVNCVRSPITAGPPN